MLNKEICRQCQEKDSVFEKVWEYGCVLCPCNKYNHHHMRKITEDLPPNCRYILEQLMKQEEINVE
jgi:hypothetical protein